jgi:hypothetical protein
MSYQKSTPFPVVTQLQIITLTVSFSLPNPPPPTPTVKETIQMEIGNFGILNVLWRQVVVVLWLYYLVFPEGRGVTATK